MEKLFKYIEESFIKICDDINKLIEKQNINKKDNTKFCYYKIYDYCKFLYILIKHSKWNRTHQPYLCCSCTKDKSMWDNVCIFLSDADKLKY